jgi:hypothetical protein
MTKTEKVNKERLQEFEKRLNQTDTRAILLIGLTEDMEFKVLTVDFPTEKIIWFLRRTADAIEQTNKNPKPFGSGQN